MEKHFSLAHFSFLLFADYSCPGCLVRLLSLPFCECNQTRLWFGFSELCDDARRLRCGIITGRCYRKDVNVNITEGYLNHRE